MAIMVASKRFVDSLNAFSFGYARLGLRKQGKQVFSLLPHSFLLFLIFLIIALLLRSRKKKHNENEEVEVENFLIKRNEGILLTDEEEPGLLTGRKEDLARLLHIALDKQVITMGETPNHVFFLLSKEDTNVFSDEVLEALGDKHVWIFMEEDANAKRKKTSGRIGKTIFYDRMHMHACGIPTMVLGIIPRFLSMITKQSDTNFDHVYAGLPERCTLSYSFPADIHASLASLLKHQKSFSLHHGETVLLITNSNNFDRDAGAQAKYVDADTEPFFISFREAA
ncbi:MAG: hypothetical protein MUC80_00510 [Candidatus Thermoplasmatota archaeon]|jgi:hypothetical protein|nr:hypothetical protein [Candidatus Thermoplasmatota archaeon]